MPPHANPKVDGDVCARHIATLTTRTVLLFTPPLPSTHVLQTNEFAHLLV